jgi:hypothetical protein
MRQPVDEFKRESDLGFRELSGADKTSTPNEAASELCGWRGCRWCGR